MDYVIAVSCTPPRVYLQVASLMGLQLVTSFIHIAKVLGSQRETTQRQLNAEQKKKVDGPRVESLNERLSMTHEKITIIEEMMDLMLMIHIFDYLRGTFNFVLPFCMLNFVGFLCTVIELSNLISEWHACSHWVFGSCHTPPCFLLDLYLKYLEWTLNDKSDGERKASVLAL